MSSADDNPAGRDPGRPPADSPTLGRKRGRIVISGVIVAAILIVFAFILLVSRCGGNASDVYGQGVEAGASAPAATGSAV
jgi:hypothetical protein